MQKDTIEIPRPISNKELEKVEKAVLDAHVTEYSFDRKGGKTTLVVPKEKVPKIYNNLVKCGVIITEENIASQ